jgi:eukaryotic-like serine/threonine-protein kinase
VSASGAAAARSGPSLPAAPASTSSSSVTALAREHRVGTIVAAVVALALLAAAGFGIYSFLARSGPAPFLNFTITQITNTGKADLAAISPDGKYILNVQNDNGMQSLWLRNIPTGSDTQIIPPSSAVYQNLMFSSDGNYVYFKKALNALGTEFNLYRAPVLGGVPKMVARDVDTDISISPDGQRMTYIRANDPEVGKYRLLSAKLDGSDETILRVASPTRGADPSFLSWSPDGQQIAYAFLSGGNMLGYVESFHIANQQVTTLSALADEYPFELKWLPDGRGLLLVYSAKGPHFEQAQIDLLSRNGRLQAITRDTARYATLTLSADGKTAASVQVKTNRSLELVDVEDTTGSKARSLSQAAEPIEVAWTPDGKLLVSDEAKITRMDPDGQNATTLLGDSGSAIRGFSVCGDKYLLLSWAFHGGGNGTPIWRVNVDGSGPKQLTSGVFDVSPTCSPDGKWVYYQAVPGSGSLMRVPIDGGKPKTVPVNKVANSFGVAGFGFISTDGKYLVSVVDITDPVTSDAHGKLAMFSLDQNAAKDRIMDVDARVGGDVWMALLDVR